VESTAQHSPALNPSVLLPDLMATPLERSPALANSLGY
jgi:hypothetical protein